MKKLGLYEFPETKEEADAWKPIIRRSALAMRVLVVAKTRIEGAWKAYVNAVPGLESHAIEQGEVLRVGATVHEPLARVLFPEFDGVPYAR